MHTVRPQFRTHAIASICLILVLLLSAAQLSPALAAQGGARADYLMKLGGYLTGPAAGDPLDIALAYLRTNKATFGLTDDDLSDIVVSDRYVTKRNGVMHLYLRQRLDGIEVFKGDINVNVARNGRIISVGNRFVGSLRAAVTNRTPKLNQIDSVKSAAKYLNLAISETLKQLTAPNGKSQKVKISRGGISQDDIPVELIYQPLDSGEVRLAWDLTLRLKDNKRWLNLRADAATGKVLSEVDWTNDADYAIEFATDAQLSPAATLGAPAAASPARLTPAAVSPVNDGSSYLVFPLPAEDPTDTGLVQQTAAHPAVAPASPFGWHDTNGASGPEFTITQGNNVHAYPDPENINRSSGDEPSGGSNLIFNFPVDFSRQPDAYRNASVTNLFYWSNIMHDVMYGYGFDEAAGNFQVNNYGRGGKGTDAVQAESQDGGGFDNANFNTPPDGVEPRMQMYLGLSGVLHVSAPASIAGDYAAGVASFGVLPTAEGVSGDVVLVDDGVGVTSDGCERFANDVAGKIALIDRGTCTFVAKVTNAQHAGAIGVIIANNAGTAPVSPGGAANSIKLVTLGVSLPTGNALKEALATETVNVTLKRDISRDGSLDNGVIVHEYGHGISNRLTGGPSHSACLSNVEQGGEGWSDFFALVLTAKPGETAEQPRPIGTWLFNQAPDGPGIRAFPYSTSMTVNPQTFLAIQQTGGEEHAVGAIWAEMLWEVYWNLVDRYGFSSDIYSGQGGNNIALQLVIDGLKLQPCDPSFVEARDAILAADQLDYSGANQCAIWAAFAKRGLGVGAASGSGKKLGDEVASNAVPASCQ